jgi:hypothetical protein
MTKPPLGKLERVDLRKQWEHEAIQFTPWLGTSPATLDPC